MLLAYIRHRVMPHHAIIVVAHQLLTWLRNLFRHNYRHHYRSVHMALMVSWQGANMGVPTVVTNCQHEGCTGWLVLPIVRRAK